MIFPIPNFLAEECAQDIASDLREIARKSLPLKDAIANGEANERDLAEYEMMMTQIRDQAQFEFYCVDTGEVYRVADYLTLRRRMLSAFRIAEIKAGYNRLIKYLQ